MRNHRLPVVVVASLVLASALVACSGSSSEPPEILGSSVASITEADIRAAFTEAGVSLEIPLDKTVVGAPLSGRIEVELVDFVRATEPVQARASVGFTQSTDRQSHFLALAGVLAEQRREDAAQLVLVWRVQFSGHDVELRGRTSLYAALGPLEVEVRGATEVPRGGRVPLRIIARDPTARTPIAGARVIGELVGDQPVVAVFEGLTDERGEHRAEVSLPAGLDVASLRVRIQSERATTVVTVPLRATGAERIALSTDKTLYKPGQSIHLRALALSGPDKAPVAGQPALVELFDARNNKVIKRRLTTDDYGVAALELPTAVEVNQGQWRIHVEIAGVSGDLQVPVIAYVLPKMKVEVLPETGFATPGATVSGRVRAHYLFGAPVTGAAVRLQGVVSGSGVIGSVELTTDATGEATFALAVPGWLPPDALQDGTLSLALEARVTDTAAQTEAGAAGIPLATGPLVLRSIDEQPALVAGVETRTWLLLQDPAGRPIAGTLQVTAGGTPQTLTTGADGLAELRFVPPVGPTSLRVEVHATDGAQRTVSRVFERTYAAGQALVLRADRALYRAGETARVEVWGPRGVDRVLLDVYRAGTGVAGQAVSLDGAGRGQLELPVTAAMRGLLTLEAFALGGPGESVRGATRVLVDPEDRLDVVLETERTTYGPGETAAVRVRVKDAAGQPQVASLGVTAVDEAVFVLGGEPSSDLRGTFSLDARSLPAGVSTAALLGADEAGVRRALVGAIAAPGFQHNTWRSEGPVVARAVQSRVDRDLDAYVATLPDALEGTEPGEDDDRVVARAGQLVDPFGRFYGAVARGSGADVLQLTSAGPDERPGTADDVVAERSYRFARRERGEEEGLSGFPGGGADAGAFASADASVSASDASVPPPPSPEGPAAEGVRADFRETVYVNPSLITDARGEARIELPLADSITTWRVSAEGSTQNGLLGAARLGFRTYQDFFVDFEAPADLTRGDEVEVPAIVYNYLGAETAVQVSLEAAPWMEVLSAAEQTVTLGPSEVRAVRFRIRALQAGVQRLGLRGQAGRVRDALVRQVRVAPGGTKEEVSFSGRLQAPQTHAFTVPADAIEGGTRVLLTVTSGFGGEAVAGVDALLQEPSGCFEQTTSTAWPNTLVARYLQATGQDTAEQRETTHALLTRGYQRLLTFESPTGGFNWWGNADPGNRILSAIMLWHLADMEGLIETDPAVAQRTLAWLTSQQQGDGAWPAGDALHSGNEVLGTSVVRTTAFIAWALAHTDAAPEAVQRATGFLARNQPTAADLYAVALTANALAKAEPAGAAARTMLDVLDGAGLDDGAGVRRWTSEVASWTGASGNAGDIETTGLAAYAFFQGRGYDASARGAVRFVASNKDAIGSWYNTQATMNALRALLAEAENASGEVEGTLELVVNGEQRPGLLITPDDADVYREIDLTGMVRAGENTVTVSLRGRGEPSYLLSRRVHRTTTSSAAPSELGLGVVYPEGEAAVGQPWRAQVEARYDGPGVRDQVIVRVGVAPGLVPVDADLDALVRSGRAARFERNPTDVTLYLMGVASGERRDLSFGLVPGVVGAVEVPASSIYLYYQPTVRAVAPAARVVVR